MILQILDFYKKRLQTTFKSNRFLIVSFFILGLVSLVFDMQKAPPIQPDIPESADTYIPEGMVLIPIEIQNKDALSQLLGGYGVVDLYMPSYGDQIRSRKVASAVKIMRAPLNPEVYAVLVTEASAPYITQYAGPFLITIQNPKAQNTQFSKQKKVLKTTILTEI